MTTLPDPIGSPVLASMTELARDGVQRPTKAELDTGLNALYSRISAARVRQRTWLRRSMIGAAAALSLLLVLQIASVSRKHLSARAPLALAYHVEGGSVLDGGYLRESGHGGIKLLFNEGSKFVLMPGTHGRLRTVDNEGARLAIENGTASFQVTQSRDRRWLVEVGPFLVTVKGTIFTVSWDPTGERFELRLRRGRVLVSGPVSGGDLALRAGQRLVVSLAKSETVITEDLQGEGLDESVGASAPSSAGPTASLPPVVGDEVTEPGALNAHAPSASGKADGGRRWTEELASGHWDRILENVDRTGIDAALNTASSGDLLALANAARYRHRTDLARAALLAQRRRFPDSAQALDAVFLLGRVEESQASGRGRAMARYDEYLTRAPMGAYAAEALGRKMTLTNEVSGSAQARLIAEEYLRRFPKGSYAGSARALLRVP